LAAWTYAGGTISGRGEPEYVNGRNISAELFSTLGISPVHGRTFSPEEDQPGAAHVAMISYGLWQRNFGGQHSAIGDSLVYESKPYTVVGIAPEGFQLDGDADVFTPLQQAKTPTRECRIAAHVFSTCWLACSQALNCPRPALSSR